MSPATSPSRRLRVHRSVAKTRRRRHRRFNPIHDRLGFVVFAAIYLSFAYVLIKLALS